MKKRTICLYLFRAVKIYGCYAVFGFLTILAGCGDPVLISDNSYSLKWTMVNVNESIQGDAHLIRVNGGKTVLIDTGSRAAAEDVLIPYLLDHEISAIDILIITHAHFDHYGGVVPLIDSGIQVGEIVFRFPDDEQCEAEIFGCCVEDIREIKEMIELAEIPVYEGTQGMVFSLGEDTELEILYAFCPDDTPVSDIDMNDESLVMRLCHDGFRFLFTGDLSEKVGGYLAENGEDLQADIIKIPHHAADPIAPTPFYDAVNPRYALSPTSSELWCSERTIATRNWLAENTIPVYINGFRGHVDVMVADHELSISSQYDNVTDAEEICIDNLK